MIKFFRKIRQKMLTENKFSKYLIYAIGEIVLVVIGILIALQINNQNEFKKQKLVEINILKGIRNDIIQDTIDINSNIRYYRFHRKQYDLITPQLINKKKKNRKIKLFLRNLTLSDRNLILYDSHFQEAKQKGLSIISNKILKEKISRLYEWYYKSLLMAENSFEQLKSAKMLDNELRKYFGWDSTGFIISNSNYESLLSNKNIVYLINLAKYKENTLLKQHQETLEIVLSVIEVIDKELIELKDK